MATDEDIDGPVKPESTEPVANIYELKLSILNNNIFTIKVSSTAITSSWFNIIAVTFAGLLIIGAFGEKIINLYNMLVK
jgi:hypothetical protein